MRTNKTEVNKMEQDINAILAETQGVTYLVSKNSRKVALGLVKRGWTKKGDNNAQ